MITVVRCDPSLDLHWMHALWHQTLAPQWALSLSKLAERLCASSLCLKAEHNGRALGFCVATYGPAEPAALLVLLVHPDYQRQGVGSVLLQELESVLTAEGEKELRLGFGGRGDYFWPGVPTQASSAWSFFANRGWTDSTTTFDLLEPLEDYKPPHDIYKHLRNAGYEFTLANPSMHTAIKEFEELRFPPWASCFRQKLNEGRHQDILVVRTGEGVVVGTVLLEGSEALTWAQDLGSRCAYLSVLGVAEDHQRQGIGRALVSRAFDTAKARGHAKCYINWTGLVDWYGKLGAIPWAEYRMSQKRLLGRSQSAVLP